MNFLNTNKFYVFVVLVALTLSGCATAKDYEVGDETLGKAPSGKIELNIKAVAIGIGGEKGKGTLTYEGKNHAFTLKGFDYGSISKVTLDASGSVYNLDKLSDFEGVYFQAKAGLTVGKAGKAGIFLVNSRGVTMHLSTDKEKGFDLSLGRGGIKVRLVK